MTKEQVKLLGRVKNLEQQVKSLICAQAEILELLYIKYSWISLAEQKKSKLNETKCPVCGFLTVNVGFCRNEDCEDYCPF